MYKTKRVRKTDHKKIKINSETIISPSVIRKEILRTIILKIEDIFLYILCKYKIRQTHGEDEIKKNNFPIKKTNDWLKYNNNANKWLSGALT